jgi:hypothetical protein
MIMENGNDEHSAATLCYAAIGGLDMAVKERNDVDPSFRQGKRRKIKTVGKLIEELQQLPPSMKVLGGFDFGVRVTVTNWNDRCLAVTIDEAD